MRQNGDGAARMNRQVVLVSRPSGIAQAENFVVREAPAPLLQADGMIVRNLFLSVEPAMRGWIADTGNYSGAVPLGTPMRALAVGEVLESACLDYKVGEIVTGWFGWQERAAVTPTDVIRRVRETDLPLSLALGVLGINGVTAHLALTLVGRPHAGETILVTTAAGSVGSAVGQIARMLGCRTVGIAGGPAKVAQCREVFGYDEAIDYKAGDLGPAIARACPNGVHVYFDNTSGPISDAVYPHLAIGARVVVCGTAAIASWDPWPSGPRLERHLLVKRALAQGFVIFDHADQWDSSVAQLATWIRAGQLTYAEHVLDGIEACPDALASLYRGENTGKLVVRL